MKANLRISAIGPRHPQLEAVMQLGRRHSNTLGFFPDGAFHDHAVRGHLLAASADATELAGYCAFRVSRGRLMIAHLCVAEVWRGKGVARLLFDGIKAYAQARNLYGIGLHCRRDYPANDLWPRLGFVPIRSKPGRGVDGTELTYWWHDLHAADLFSAIDAVDKRLRVVVDCNVFRDLHDTSTERNKEAPFLAADWVAAQVELCSVGELQVELNRIALTELREALLRHAQRYRSLAYNTARSDAVFSELMALLGHSAPNSKQASDMRHVAMSAAADADVFLTRDEELLGRAPEIEERYGLQVMRPVELISRLNEAEQAALYQPSRFASTDIQKIRPKPEHAPALAEALHVPSQHETRDQFAAKLRHLLCDVESEVSAAVADGVPLFLVAHRQVQARREIMALRCTRTALATTALRHALLLATTEVARRGGGIIVVSESLLSDEVQSVLHELGFRLGTKGWQKITLRALGDISAISQVLVQAGHPPLSPNATAKEIEAQYWPAKIIGADVDTWSVPIRSTWATALFETSFADEQLFRPKRELILSRENVYYSAAIQSGMEGATGRLLWYVSTKDPHQAGAKTIRACSRLLEVRRGSAKSVFNAYRRLGVYEWEHIREMVAGDPTKEILALRFADTELFERPFPGEQASALGIRNNFTSPVKVPESAFTAIYRHGMKLPTFT
ncbi:MAG: GNAT family N-acetyltransferase [Bryobacteraceae bacterium]|nr:GNAT family N-acetyltransferase [Bryobacteraceae bacterium]